MTMRACQRTTAGRQRATAGSLGLRQDVKGNGRTPDDYAGTLKAHGWASKGYSGESRAVAGRQRERLDARFDDYAGTPKAHGPWLGVKGLQLGV